MTTIEIKKNFHSLIDSIDNENILLFFYDLMKRRSTSKEGQIWNRLSNDQKQELLLSVRESENPDNLISHEDLKNKHKKWL
jgi:hypothetical protein